MSDMQATSFARSLWRTAMIGAVFAVLVWLGSVDLARAEGIDGYRSAHFGMTKAEVLRAIQMDFDIEGGETRIVHPLQKTTALVVRADSLVFGAGATQLVYIFGYRSERLIQVTLNWGHPLETAVDAATLVRAARAMMNRMALQGLPRNTLSSDMAVDDGSIIVFRANDADAHVIEMRMKGPGIGPAADNGNDEATSWLRLSFIQDAESPDTYRIEPGAF